VLIGITGSGVGMGCRQMLRIEYWKQRARELEKGGQALCLAARDPRVPWYAKALVVLVAAYAVSPIDLIPDFIPVLGYLDDLLLLPLGIALAIRLIPAEVWRDCLARAQTQQKDREPRRWMGAALIVGIWLLVLGAVACVLIRRL